MSALPAHDMPRKEKDLSLSGFLSWVQFYSPKIDADVQPTHSRTSVWLFDALPPPTRGLVTVAKILGHIIYVPA